MNSSSKENITWLKRQIAELKIEIDEMKQEQSKWDDELGIEEGLRSKRRLIKELEKQIKESGDK